MPKVVNSWNEWDPLKRVIVGRPEGTNIFYSNIPGSAIRREIWRTFLFLYAKKTKSDPQLWHLFDHFKFITRKRLKSLQKTELDLELGGH